MKLLAYSIVKLVTWLILRIWNRLEVTGQENVPTQGPVLLATNHVSYLDPVVVGVASPRQVVFMAQTRLWKTPFMRLYLWLMDCIPVERGTVDRKAIRESIKRLKAGSVVGIFPEGERQHSGELSQAKRGVGLLAVHAGVPIVPVFVQGTHEALPRGGGGYLPVKIQVAFGPQILYTDLRFSTGRPEGESHSARHEALAQAVTASWRQLSEKPESTKSGS